MVGEKPLRVSRRPARVVVTPGDGKHSAHALVVMETRQDKEEALRAVGGNGARWLDNASLGDLFARLQDGFDRCDTKSDLITGR